MSVMFCLIPSAFDHEFSIQGFNSAIVHLTLGLKPILSPSSGNFQALLPFVKTYHDTTV